jgi:hypothetical protein
LANVNNIVKPSEGTKTTKVEDLLNKNKKKTDNTVDDVPDPLDDAASADDIVGGESVEGASADLTDEYDYIDQMQIMMDRAREASANALDTVSDSEIGNALSSNWLNGLVEIIQDEYDAFTNDEFYGHKLGFKTPTELSKYAKEGESKLASTIPDDKRDISDIVLDSYSKPRGVIDVGFDVLDKQAVNYLQDYNFELIQRVSDDVRIGIKGATLKGIAIGETNEKIRDRILNHVTEPFPVYRTADMRAVDKGLKNIKDCVPIRVMTPQSRSMMIARTETMRAYNQGNLMRYKSIGVPMLDLRNLANQCVHCGAVVADAPYPIDDAPYVPVHPHCYDKETEVYTNNGWKLFKDVNDIDLILSINPETHETEFLPFNKKIEYQYQGEIYHIHNRWFDMKVTDEHDIYTERRTGAKRIMKPYFVKPTQLNSEHRIPRTCDNNNESPKFIDINGLHFTPEDYAYLMAWWLSEGYIESKVPNKVGIVQLDDELDIIYKRVKNMLGCHVSKSKDRIVFYSK